MRARPNVVVCMCDQLRPFEMGCYGNGVIRTPHMDALGREGVRFEVAVSNNPVCMPARSSLLSGQYSRTCVGRLGNYAEQNESGKWVLPEYPAEERKELLDATLPECFRAVGYDTALIGKWHIQPSPRQVGFDTSVYPLVHHRHTRQVYVENEGRGREIEGFSLDFEAERVGDYLRTHRDRPFFLFYNISPPHMPLLDAPEKYLTMYSPDEVLLRPNAYRDGKLPWDEHWFKIYLWDFLYYDQKQPFTEKLPEGFDLRKLTALYYGLTSWADDMVGRLMGNLREAGLEEDTIVVFLSDHGDHLGSHHLFNKGTLVEESIRIPMIFHAPGRLAPRVNEGQVASIVDVMPTVLGLCGMEIPGCVQGQDLTAVLRGERDCLEQSGSFIETTDGEIGIRTAGHLYGVQLRGFERAIGETRRFHDLNADPYELDNLADTNREASTAERLHAQLAAWHNVTPWLKPR